MNRGIGLIGLLIVVGTLAVLSALTLRTVTKDVGEMPDVENPKTAIDAAEEAKRLMEGR